MRVFIIRPFGTKEGIDFERVDAELIRCALEQLNQQDFPIFGATTGLISKQGNIREDMFRLIAVSDLVIADVSIHNANVFYELGMRHALRPRHSFLIRSKTDHPYPFDLQTDRYFLYDAADPHASVAGLVQALRATLASSGTDSPMFSLLPALSPHGRGQLISVPAEFKDDVERAQTCQNRGKLRLFASEVLSFAWDQEGLRMIGDAQFKLRAFAGARDTFELLQRTDSRHVHANLRLGTIYQRLTLLEPPERKADLIKCSEQAIQRVLDTTVLLADRVEAYCLLASNEKSRWIDELAGTPPADHHAATLRSVHFSRMLRLYLQAANQDLNAHYPATNALALLKIQIALARSLPDAWQQLHDTDAGAAAALAAAEKLAGHLTSTLCLALELDEMMGQGTKVPDPWAAGSRADFMLLTASARTARVKQYYQAALTGADWFALEATRRNLEIYKRLGQFEPGVSTALDVVDAAMAANGKPHASPAKVLLFAGHMVDASDRPEEARRFPRTPEATAQARAMIFAAVEKEVAGHAGDVLGIAGGASGGDILFHEVCEELGVPTALYLALPEDRFEVTSVQQGGADWVERYRALTGRLAPHVLQQTKELPKWLADKPGYDVWQRNNLWLMFSALATGARGRTLLALYNRERESDSPGGTAHLVAEAATWGFKVIELDARALLPE